MKRVLYLVLCLMAGMVAMAQSPGLTIGQQLEDYDLTVKYIEDNGYELVSGGFEQIPNVELKDVTDDQRATLDKLTGMLEDDEDVTNVYTTLAPEAE